MSELETFTRLLAGSVVYRPYVYVFFAAFLGFALYQMGWKRTLVFTVSTYVITYLCEFSSTRNGFPFGPYTYNDVTRTRELWLSNVPFWDSLSFVFLSYFSFVVASVIFTPGRELNTGRWSGVQNKFTPIVGGLVMMLLDVVIDPVTLQGDKWFLGHIYDYPYRGFYFGVTLANFLGWFFVGFASQFAFQRLLRVLPFCRGEWKPVSPLFIWCVYAVYAGVFAFNLAITIWIEDYSLAAASAVVSATTLAVAGSFLKKRIRQS